MADLRTIYLLSIGEVDYVGQTKTFVKRKREHISELKRGTHCNRVLQAAFRLHGTDAVVFTVLEADVPADKANRLESDWMEVFHISANIIPYSSNSVGCRWNGVAYRSISEAARVAGVQNGTMMRWLKCGYTHDGDTPKRARPVTWNGVQYPSMTRAAISNGCDKERMKYWLKKGYSCDEDVPEHLRQRSRPEDQQAS
jgi:hypothetical protein